MLIDSGIFIDHLRGHRPASVFLKQMRQTVGVMTSVVVVGEVVAGARDRRDQTVIDQMFSAIKVEPLTAADGDAAL